MRIGLIDVDGSKDFPSQELMLLSAYHKHNGDQVEWYDPLDGGRYEVVYKFKRFKHTQDFYYDINCIELVDFGAGYGKTMQFPEEAQEMDLDYSIYDYYTLGNYVFDKRDIGELLLVLFSFVMCVILWKIIF